MVAPVACCLLAAAGCTGGGYHAWQVYVTTTAGTRRLPEGCGPAPEA